MHESFIDGLPVRRASDPGGIYADGTLWDRSDIRRHRFRVPDLGEAVAQYWTAYQYAPLFRRDALTPMPALPPKRQAAYDAARTCVRCGVRSVVRLHTHWRRRHNTPRDKQTLAPMCQECPRIEDEVSWKARANADRIAAVALARDLVAQGFVAYLEERGKWESLRRAWFTAIAVDHHGRTVFHHQIEYTSEYTYNHDPSPEGVVPIEQVADAARQLAGERLASWWPGHNQHLYTSMKHALGEELALPHQTWNDPSPVVDVADLTACWRARPQYHGRWDCRGYHSYGSLTEAAGLLLGGEIQSLYGQAMALHSLVAHVARDEHPAGPPRCPERHLDLECGVTSPLYPDGFCWRHTSLDTESSSTSERGA